MKTISLKKVSAVAVASLGFGLLSVVPAQAANSVAGDMTSISLAKVTSTPTINAAVNVNVGMLMAADFTGTTIVKGVLTAVPSGGYVGVTPVVGGSNGTTAFAGGDAVASGAITITNPTVAEYVAATATAGNFSMTFTPTVAGTYTLTVWNDAAATPDNALGVNEVRQTLNITVVAAAGISASLSTAYQTITTAAAATSTTDTVPARVVKTLSATAAAAITVTLKDTAGDAITSADAITLGATVSGDAGGVAAAIHYNATPVFGSKCTGNQPVRVATSATYTAVAQIYFCASNQSGTSTITVTATDADGNITTIGSETISYYGDVASLSVTPVHTIIRAAAGTTGDNTATRVSTTAPAAMVVTAKDSKGMLVGNLTTLSVTGTAGIASISCNEDIYDTGTSGAYGLGGEGNYGCTVTSTGAAVSAGKDTVQIRIVDPADSTKYIYATTQNVTFGGAPSTVTMSFDKTSYTAGAKGVLTVTVTDSAGNPASDGVYATLFSGASTTNLTGSTPGAAVVVIGGKKTYDVYLPNAKGTATVTNTLGATIASKVGATVSATIEVADPNAGLLTQIDALNAKIVALNALIAKIMKKLGVK